MTKAYCIFHGSTVARISERTEECINAVYGYCLVYVSKSADRECSFYDTVGNHLYDYNVKETKGLITKPESDIHLFLKYKYGNRKFWCRGYFVDTLGRNKNQFHEYIRNQLKDDYMSDQLSAAEQITSSHWWF